MIIKNKKQLATTKLRKTALEIIEAGIKSVLPVNLMRSVIKYNAEQKILTVQNKKYAITHCHCERPEEAKQSRDKMLGSRDCFVASPAKAGCAPRNDSMFSQGRIFVVGGGKAAGLMAEELEKIINIKNITAGIVNCKDNKYKTKKIQIIKASHPIPDQAGVRGVEKMLALKKEYAINKNDFVICLISGGASALMPSPVDEISLKDIQKTTKLLLASGANIQEINTIRKHLSKIKGGQLAKFFSPAAVVSLIISDVVGNDLETIGSGPTVADTSTFQDAYNVLKKYGLFRKAPKSIIAHIKNGCEDKAKETPKKLNNCYNCIIGDNILALNAMKDKANQFGLKPLIVTAKQIGNTAKAAQIRAREIINKKYKSYNVILIGGETTPTLPKNHGKGGRNQHFAASSILAMEKYSGDWAMAGTGTDGSDYATGAAGAIVDNNSLLLAKSKKINVELYLKKYNSNALFKKINNSLIITGNTGTNVGDIMIYILN